MRISNLWSSVGYDSGMGTALRCGLAMTLLAAGSASARDYGPPVGSKLPAFDLQDQSGNKHTLQSLLGPKGAMILFFRSADW